MQFINHTAHPALAFGGIDQHDESFHVVVLRQTLSWDETGLLHLIEDQSPLCEADEYIGDIALGDVHQESDLCHYKPKCDVLVAGRAHAPIRSNGKPAEQFDVRLLVRQADRPAPLPEPPQSLNPSMAPSADAMARWRKEVEKAKNTAVPGATLVDKTLRITGTRDFVRRSGMARQLGAGIKLGSLGLIDGQDWQLSAPTPVHHVPLSISRTFGGQVRIEADSPFAAKVPHQHQLTAEHRGQHPSAPDAPLAHAAWPDNPWGTGFAAQWHLAATGADRVTAPQIEHPQRPISAADFVAAGQGRLAADVRLVQGLGVRPKGHPQRAKLVGTVDEAFARNDKPLPQDFKFEVWNAAWPDQQTAFLQGDEVVGLINLCTANMPGAWRDERGNTLLRLKLPGISAHLFVRMASGEMFEHPMSLDTVFIEPDERRVGLVWRAIIADLPEVPLRLIEAFTLSAQQRQAMREDMARKDELLHRSAELSQPAASGDLDG